MGAQPRWIGYVGVNDVDAAPTGSGRPGGTVHVPPTDIPNVSRFSVVADPQMATLRTVQVARTPARSNLPRWVQPGRVGWHELFAADWEKAFAFYREAFRLAEGGRRHGADGHLSAVLRRRADRRRHVHQACRWCRSRSGSTTSTSATIDAAAERVKAGGGKILDGPVEVPGGSGSSDARTLRAPCSR